MIGIIDKPVFYFVNNRCHDVILDQVMPVITELGNGVFLFGLALAMLVFKRKRVRVSGILIMAGLTFSYHVTSILKHMIARPRPFLVLEGAKTVFTTGGFSFPSNHAAMAFTAAVIMTQCFGKPRLFYTIAVIVAISRVYLGLHFPSDVLAGGFIGFIVGYVLIYIVEQTGMYKEQNA